jgi:hypothetical protein
MGHMTLFMCLLPLLIVVPDVYCAAYPTSQPNRYFAIQVVDEQTGRGVPMVELQTTSGVQRIMTEKAGSFWSKRAQRRSCWLGRRANRISKSPISGARPYSATTLWIAA